MYALDALYERLTSIDHIERSARQGTLHAFLSELDWGIAALRTDERAQALRAIQAALRVDLAFLLEHPDATFACLYYRLAWYVPAAARAAAEACVQPLRRTLQVWCDQKHAAGARWIKSLRPPEHALGGPLMEEYRADAPEHFRRVRLSDEGRVVELAYRLCDRSQVDAQGTRAHHCIRWNRTTGARLAQETIQLGDTNVSPDMSIRIQHDGWGKADVHAHPTGMRIGSLDLSSSYHVSSVAFASDADVVALTGWDDDCGGFVSVYNSKSHVGIMHVAANAALYRVGISPHGELIAASGSGRTYVWAVKNRRCLCELPSYDAVVQPLDARLLVTAELGVVRIWDLERPSPTPSRYRGGLSNAAFSPNGERLVTGSCLVDARDGAHVSDLDFEQVDYFVGGPPRDAFAIGNERLVSLERGLRVWDARTGSQLQFDRERSVRYWEVVALTPCATRYALTHRARFGRDTGETQVCIIDTHCGNELSRFSTSGVTCMAWAPDGRTLATGSVDGRLRLWDGARGTLLRVLHESAGPVADLAFLRNGTYLASGSDRDAVRVWRTHTSDLIFERALTNGDPLVRTWRQGQAEATSYYTWEASREALDAIDDQLDALKVAEPRNPWAMVCHTGALAIVDRALGEAIAWFPANERMAAHPHEPIWAGGPVHLRLESPNNSS